MRRLPIQRSTRRGHATIARALLVSATILASPTQACMGESPAKVLAEFNVAPRGDLVTLPVTIGTRTYHFALSTEDVTWIVDESLRAHLRKNTDGTQATAANGAEGTEWYETPPMRVGALSVPPSKAVCVPISVDYLQSGRHHVCGVVPAEFLRDKIFRIDFDRGKLEFLRTVPEEVGRRFELTWKDGVLWLALDIGGAGREEFQIATRHGFKSGALREPLFDHLVASGRMDLIGTADDSQYSPVDRLPLSPQATLDHFVVGPFRHEAAIFSAASRSRLELGYLSRYNVIFDFAHSAIYLKPGRCYSRPDRYSALAGLLVASGAPEVFTLRVKRGGPAERAGLSVYDEIIKVDDVLAEKTPFFELARILATPGEHTVRFRRPTERAERETTLILNECGHATDDSRVKRGQDQQQPAVARTRPTEAAESRPAQICAHGQCAPQVPADVVAEFNVAKQGDLVTLPVTVADRTYSFLLTTENGAWVFDESLRSLLGSFIDRLSDGTQMVERYQMPALRVGPLAVPPGKAACLDLQELYGMSGHDIRGVIAAEFLRGKVFRIDFDRGKFQLLRAVPGAAGERFNLVWKEGVPRLLLDIPGAGKEEFLIALQRGLKSGSLRVPLFDQLVASGQLKPLGTAEDAEYSVPDGWVAFPQARMDALRVGAFQHEGAIFGASRHNTLELGYLSRYEVTFDLAHSALYLKRGSQYSRPDLYSAVAGLSIAADRKEVRVFRVKDQGPAQQAGLEFFDEIVKVDERFAENTSSLELARLLSTPGVHTLRFRRDPERAERETTIVLNGPNEDVRLQPTVGR